MLETKRFDDLYELTKKSIKVVELEQLIYAIATAETEGEYNGGFWSSKLVKVDTIEATGNFWFFSLNTKDENEKYSFPNNNRQKTEQVSSECLSLLCNMFALNQFMLHNGYDEDLTELIEELTNMYHAIRLNANQILSKEELDIFYSIID